MKTIWIFNHYAAGMFEQHGGRHYQFAKHLIRAGYDVRIFCASTIHNSDENLITDGSAYFEDSCDGIPFTIVKARSYTGNGKTRVLNMIDYYRALLKVTKKYPRPDVILGSSVHPLACVAAIRLSKRYGCKNIVEIRDLWPESFVSIGLLRRGNPILPILYAGEKWIFKKADAIIFTMEGGRDYIADKGWYMAHGGPVNLNKLYYINNGVDLEKFDENRERYAFFDPDLDDPGTVKVIYTGSIRKVNASILILPEVAKCLQNKGKSKYKILIYGAGDRVGLLQSMCEGMTNIRYKGYVEKSCVPYVLSKADVTILDCDTFDITRYGGSQNKLFEYLASGKPILSGQVDKYCIVRNERCGVAKKYADADEIADALIELAEGDYSQAHIREVAKQYDFAVLTQRLIDVINSVLD